MNCSTNSNTSNIEDLVVTPLRDFVEDPIKIEIIEKVVVEMLKTPISSDEQMRKFITKQQKIVHMVLDNMTILYIYKRMLQAGKIKRHKEYEPFLMSKKVRGSSG